MGGLVERSIRESGRSAAAGSRQERFRRGRHSTAALRASMSDSILAWQPAADGRCGSLRPVETTPARPRAELRSLWFDRRGSGANDNLSARLAIGKRARYCPDDEWDHGGNELHPDRARARRFERPGNGNSEKPGRHHSRHEARFRTCERDEEDQPAPARRSRDKLAREPGADGRAWHGQRQTHHAHFFQVGTSNAARGRANEHERHGTAHESGKVDEAPFDSATHHRRTASAQGQEVDCQSGKPAGKPDHCKGENKKVHASPIVATERRAYPVRRLSSPGCLSSKKVVSHDLRSPIA